MAKSIKLKNNNYIDSTGIVHNRELLSDVLNSIKYNLRTNGSAVKTGRKIDGKEEYVKRYKIMMPFQSNPSYYCDSGLDINDIEIINIIGTIRSTAYNVFSSNNPNYNGGYAYCYYNAQSNKVVVNCSTQNYGGTDLYATVELYYTYK